MGEEDELRWTVHPLLEEPAAKSVLLIAIILGITAGVTISFESGPFGFLSFAFLSGSLSRYFLPTRYALDEAGVCIVHAGVRRRIPWQRVRRVNVSRDGILLSPTERPSRTDSFRGCFLRFRGNGDEVTHFVRVHVS
jgi:hypothetical protein